VVNGRTVPTFPRARYVVQMGEWEDATHPHERSRASYREENFVPLAESRQLDTVQGAVGVAPGVRVVPVGGHTAYHQMVVVEGGGQTLAIPTDLLPTTSHLPLPFVMGYDLFPVGTLEAKRRLLERAARERWTLLFYHDPRVALGRVRMDGDRCVLDGTAA
jgi:glyoxylase-like metal-dependent hydrolase (beta-lactamase superfamily II)